MPHVGYVRLDSETKRLLHETASQLGWSDSRVVREGIKALNVTLGPGGARRIIGLGRFRSGTRDLGSNKTHLRDFGRENIDPRMMARPYPGADSPRLTSDLDISNDRARRWPRRPS